MSTLRGKVATVVIIRVMPVSRGNNEGVFAGMIFEIVTNSPGHGAAASDAESTAFAKVILHIDNEQAPLSLRAIRHHLEVCQVRATRIHPCHHGFQGRAGVIIDGASSEKGKDTIGIIDAINKSC